MAESFVDTFKTELIADRVWRTRTQLELAIVEWVAWFNTDRLHESLGDIPPAEFETLSRAVRSISLPLLITREPTNPVSAEPSPAHVRARQVAVVVGAQLGDERRHRDRSARPFRRRAVACRRRSASANCWASPSRSSVAGA